MIINTLQLFVPKGGATDRRPSSYCATHTYGPATRSRFLVENATENTGVRLVRNTAASDSDGAGVASDVGADVATHPAPGSTTT